ncbi:Poly [ADP-ribose] polymerase 9 [Merluccius polli]|uniref:Poly [ADP-ribose] polymerase 9 n=1 Tax=Merluccius polli TaxID=89951 RepID=A0AA47MSG1_MERPO|nr:Poly [ADP-ribose] polymerase 9 [Merluccius polli]
MAQKSTQNYTRDNRTQGIMEKSQWDLKKIRFQQKRLTRMDDFVHTYQHMHDALLREYQDSLKTKNKTHRVEVEKWKQRKQRRRGVYVTPITKPFDFKKHQEKKDTTSDPSHDLSEEHGKGKSGITKPSPEVVTSQLKSPRQSTSIISDAQKPSSEHVLSQFDTEGAPFVRMADVTVKRKKDQVKTLSAELSQSMEVCVWKADLATFVFDGVVNAANENLQHGGSLALALCKAGGTVIQAESDLKLPCQWLSPECVCGDGWFILGDMIAHAPQVCSPTQPESNQSDSGQLTSLWKIKDTEVVVAVLPSHTRGNNLVIRHSELRSLRPHQWLTGEVIEVLFHLSASQFNMGNSIYILNHYTAGVILFGKRTELRQQGLSKLQINFGNYQAVLSFVNIGRVHWKMMYIFPALASVFLVDPAANSSEEADSEDAAKRVSEYFKMRRICYGKEDWGTVKWRGATMHHPVQQDGSSCGVIVTMVTYC